jgi:beta-phosphoglucomutase-like phosphatase (HAD superfamily)
MNLTDFSAVIFDMDGLVLDTETTYCIAKQQAARALGYEMTDQFWLSLSGMHAQDIEQELLSHCGTEFDLSRFNQSAEQIWRDYVHVNGLKTKHGFYQLLDFIVDQPLPYCLATNSNAVNAEKCLKLAGLESVFPIRITRDDVRQGKPEPDIFFKAAEQMHVDINRCLVLEDSHIGILAASRAGAYSVLVPSVLPVDPITLSLCNVMMRDLACLLETLRA